MSENINSELRDLLVELKATIRSGHELLQDLYAIDRELGSKVNAAESRISANIEHDFERLAESEIRTKLDELVPQVQSCLDDAVKAVNAKFDRFSRILLGRESSREEPLEDTISAYARRNGLL